MKCAVVGLGKIGLPLLAQIASGGVEAVGCDINPEVVEAVRSGDSPIAGEPGLAEAIRRHVQAGTMTATTETVEAVAAADIVVVVVPLGIDPGSKPDFSTLDAAVGDVGRGLQPGGLVIVETTVPVGTTRNRVTRLLERESGLEAGSGFHVAFSPERVSSGSVFRDLRRYPKLVGGIDDESAKAAAAFYERILSFDERPDLDRPNGVWVLESAEAAEFTKLAETTYRDVNIALANEFAEHAEAIGADFSEIVEAANSQPFSHIHRPGLVGGHCIPVYPHLYLSGDPGARLPTAGREVNNAVSARIVDRLIEAVGDLSGMEVAVLGATYRGGVKETANSGVFPLATEIGKRGGTVSVHDALLTPEELRSLGFEPYRLGDKADVAVVQTDHPEYQSLTADDIPGCRVLFDVRSTVDPDRMHPIQVLRLGRASEEKGSGG